MARERNVAAGLASSSFALTLAGFLLLAGCEGQRGPDYWGPPALEVRSVVYLEAQSSSVRVFAQRLLVGRASQALTPLDLQRSPLDSYEFSNLLSHHGGVAQYKVQFFEADAGYEDPALPGYIPPTEAPELTLFAIVFHADQSPLHVQKCLPSSDADLIHCSNEDLVGYEPDWLVAFARSRVDPNEENGLTDAVPRGFSLVRVRRLPEDAAARRTIYECRDALHDAFCARFDCTLEGPFGEPSDLPPPSNEDQAQLREAWNDCGTLRYGLTPAPTGWSNPRAQDSTTSYEFLEVPERELPADVRQLERFYLP